MDVWMQLATNGESLTEWWRSLSPENQAAVIVCLLFVAWLLLQDDSSNESGTSYHVGHLRKADPDTFERLVAEAWSQQGYETEVTPRTGDRGIDVIANGDEEMVVIQAKRHQEGNDVSSPTVRNVAGARQQFEADRAIIATSAGFTGPAEDAAEKLDIELVDGHELAEMLSD